MLQPNDTVILFLQDHLLFCESPIRFSSHYEIDIEKVSFSFQQKSFSVERSFSWILSSPDESKTDTYFVKMSQPEAAHPLGIC